MAKNEAGTRFSLSSRRWTAEDRADITRDIQGLLVNQYNFRLSGSNRGIDGNFQDSTSKATAIQTARLQQQLVEHGFLEERIRGSRQIDGVPGTNTGTAIMAALNDPESFIHQDTNLKNFAELLLKARAAGIKLPNRALSSTEIDGIIIDVPKADTEAGMAVPTRKPFAKAAVSIPKEIQPQAQPVTSTFDYGALKINPEDPFNLGDYNFKTPAIIEEAVAGKEGQVVSSVALMQLQDPDFLIRGVQPLEEEMAARIDPAEDYETHQAWRESHAMRVHDRNDRIEALNQSRQEGTMQPYIKWLETVSERDKQAFQAIVNRFDLDGSVSSADRARARFAMASYKQYSADYLRESEGERSRAFNGRPFNAKAIEDEIGRTHNDFSSRSEMVMKDTLRQTMFVTGQNALDMEIDGDMATHRGARSVLAYANNLPYEAVRAIPDSDIEHMMKTGTLPAAKAPEISNRQERTFTQPAAPSV